MKKYLSLIFVLCLALCVAVFSNGCKKNEKQEPSATTYTIEVGTEGGMAFSEISVFVYTDDSLTDLVWVGKTDEAGKMTFEAPASENYVAVLQDIPEGYIVESSYPLTGEVTKILLAVELVKVEDWTALRYELGDVIHDFSVTACDGTEYKLSELLKEKQAIVLNFWYLECEPCKNEFPYLQEAYDTYKDAIEVLAMNPVNDDADVIAAFKEEYKLAFPLAAVDPAWEDVMQLQAYPTTVVIDRYGTISLIHLGSITNKETFEEIFAHFVTEDYKQGVVEDTEDIVEYEEEEGESESSAAEVGGVREFEATVKGKKLKYYDLYKVDGMILQIHSEDAYVVYNDKTYKPQNGIVSVPLSTPDTYTPASFAIGNSSKKKQTFKVTLVYLQGTRGNPYTLEHGKFTAHVDKGNDQGVYYEYKAKKDGTLTIKCLGATKGVDYEFVLYNLDSYAYRNFSEDGVTNKKGVRSVSVKVKKGDTVQFSIGSLPDTNNEYPAADFKLKAVFKKSTGNEKDDSVKMTDYKVTVIDDNGKPMSDVNVKIGDSSVKTNSKGIASANLQNGTYKALVSLPVGYRADKTEYTLTEKNPTVTVKLTKIVVVKKTYTVNVVDENGTGVPNVAVAIGERYGVTDSKGVISLELEMADYKVVISAPEGYVTEQSSYQFVEGNTSLNVVLLRDESVEDDSKITYSVTVVDYQQVPIADVQVMFWDGDTVVAMSAVNAQGVASAKLMPGDYKVTLAFSSGNYYFDEESLVLTEEDPANQILVAKRLSKYINCYFDSSTYVVDMGGSYTTMQPEVVNYYLFTPEVAGQYRVSVSGAQAQISYWGGNVNFAFDLTSTIDHDASSFTLNVKEGNLGNDYIIGITGASECVLQVIRIGNPILSDIDLPFDVYEGKTTPKAFSISAADGKKLTYIDVTKATSAYKVVYNAVDGYYHLNSTSGPILYANLGGNAPYLSIQTMLGTAGLRAYFYENGELIKKEDYYDCMMGYINCIDSKYGIYPVTEDLKYMIQSYGNSVGWWDKDSYAYLFEGETINEELGWMFMCCYVK